MNITEPELVLALPAYRKREKIITELNYMGQTASLCQFSQLSHKLEQFG